MVLSFRFHQRCCVVVSASRVVVLLLFKQYFVDIWMNVQVQMFLLAPIFDNNISSITDSGIVSIGIVSSQKLIQRLFQQCQQHWRSIGSIAIILLISFLKENRWSVGKVDVCSKWSIANLCNFLHASNKNTSSHTSRTNDTLLLLVSFVAVVSSTSALIDNNGKESSSQFFFLVSVPPPPGYAVSILGDETAVENDDDDGFVLIVVLVMILLLFILASRAAVVVSVCIVGEKDETNRILDVTFNKFNDIFIVIIIVIVIIIFIITILISSLFCFHLSFTASKISWCNKYNTFARKVLEMKIGSRRLRYAVYFLFSASKTAWCNKYNTFA